MSRLPEYPYLRDGIDVYVGNDNEVTFVYLSSRKRLQLKCHPGLIQSLTWMRGRKTVTDILSMFREQFPESDLSDHAITAFVSYLHDKNIVIDEGWFEKLNLPLKYQERLQRQLHFLMDMVDTPLRVEEIQQRIMNTQVAIFGVGAIGSWISRELVMLGFQRFVLVDPDISESSDAARHAFIGCQDGQVQKVHVVAEGLRAIDPDVIVATHAVAINIDTELDELISGVGLIVNAADEPYIGYTSVKLSRHAVRNNLPLLIAGGFDAHLASFGEMIIPRQTPCADCYANYFRVSLANWKPVPHPVTDRGKGFGGWSPLSVISASAATLQILKYFIDPKLACKGQRTEFLATDYSTYSFEVMRDQKCKICGD